jgi:FkbM family methyltransferase
MNPKIRKLLPRWTKRLAQRVLPEDTFALLARPELRAVAAMLPDGAEPITVYCVGARGDLMEGMPYLQRQGKFRFVGFEPDPVEAERLRETKLWDVVVGEAVGSRDTTATLYMTENPGCASLYEPHTENVQRLFEEPRWFRVVSQKTVKVNRLDSIVRQQELPPPEILQIDVQGYELEVLKGAGGLLDHVLVIHLEAHFYELYREQPLFPQIHEYMSAQGFMLMSLLKATRRFGGRYVECNAYYISDRRPQNDRRLQAAFAFYKPIIARN